jgi:hypothetical protein
MEITFIPYLNTVEGMSLTPAQWQNIGVSAFAYKIEPLLQRPGFGQAFSLKAMAVVEAKIYLDLSELKRDGGSIQYRQPDGCMRKIPLQALDLWVAQLQADEIIWDATKAHALRCSNLPAEHAFLGYFYSKQQAQQLITPEYEHDFSVLSEDCDCQSCQSQLTRAYLHHLFQHTPLLAQRYLLIHNARQCCLDHA